MYCSKCGKENISNQNFCSQCGCELTSNPEKLDIEGEQVLSADITKNKTKKKIILFSCIALVLVLAVVIVFLFLPKRVSFDAEYSAAGIEEFLDVVCDNADVDSIEVKSVKNEDKYYMVTLIVKLSGMVEEEVSLRFYNKEDSDKVSRICIYYSYRDSENQTNCIDAVVEALEVSFCGSPNAKRFTKMLPLVGPGLEDYNDSSVVADYQLTDEAGVRIVCSGSFGSEWTGTYYVYKK